MNLPPLADLEAAVEGTARALEQEEFLLVCDRAREALRLWTDASGEQERTEVAHLRMHYAAAQARLGYTLDARRQLERYAHATPSAQARLPSGLRVDILLQLGNILRQEAALVPLRAARNQLAARALDFYQRALEIDAHRLDALTLAATVGFTISQPGSVPRTRAAEQARLVLSRARELAQTSGSRFDLTSGRAAALAVLGRADEAAATFGELAALPGATTAGLTDARYWARSLAEAMDLPADFFCAAFPPLQLLVFSGQQPVEPAEVAAVRAALRTALADAGATVGLVSAAAGADLLFAEALRQRGGAVHLILPWAEAEFCRTSVTPFEPAGQPPLWQPLFDQATAAAATLRVIGEAYRPTSDVGLAYTQHIMAGLALQTARTLRLDVRPMAFWDGSPTGGQGTTASFVALWRQLGHEPVLLPAPPRLAVAAHRPPPAASASGREPLRQEVKSLLFADIVGYSKLREEAIPAFIGVFLAAVSRLLATSTHAPRYVNTWGDAIYAVFDSAHAAGCFAMELLQLVRDGQSRWLQEGLAWSERSAEGEARSHALNIRVGLHAGPVFLHHNALVGQEGFTGVHVNRAARIEPVTAPGEVFASEEFAALAELEAARRAGLRPPAATKDRAALEFRCEYAGSMALAKGYPGRHRLYRVAPHRVFALEELARVIHQDYCAAEAAKGQTVAENPSMRPWEDLSETLRDSNRAQAAAIPDKLAALGYELAPSFGLPPDQVECSAAQAAALSRQEHDRWMEEKLRGGWTFGPVRDDAALVHPLIIPWEQLPEAERAKDAAAVRNVPRLVEKAGFRLRPIVQAT